RTVADADETPENRHSALHRLADHYLHKVAVASEIMHPDTAHRRRPIPEPAAPVTGFADAAAALGWLNAERGNLLAVGVSAADNGFPRHTIHLSELLWRYISIGAHVDMNDLYRRAVTASRLIGDRAGEATARLNLGVTLQRLNLFDEAEEHLARAEGLAAASGNVDTEALAVVGLGRGRRRVRDFVGAEAASRHALDLFRTKGDRYGEITALTHLALALGPQRRFPEAGECLEAALALARAIDSPNSIADVVANSGVVLHHEGRHEQARERLLLGLEMHRELGRVRGAAVCLNVLGLTATALGDPAEAVARHEAALECIGAAGEPLVRGHAHLGLARAHRALGRPDPARRHAEQALALYTAIGGHEADEVRELLGALGDVARA
ncbi:MAG: tetratricopeptide repeat protein, partial [Catenulispora sp.]|nr:tetratricopeptide repeat protein [Catenulispora sp.]